MVWNSIPGKHQLALTHHRLMCYKVRQEDNLSRSSVNGRFPNWAAWLTGERSLRAVSSSGMKRTAAAGC